MDQNSFITCINVLLYVLIIALICCYITGMTMPLFFLLLLLLLFVIVIIFGMCSPRKSEGECAKKTA